MNNKWFWFFLTLIISYWFFFFLFEWWFSVNWFYLLNLLLLKLVVDYVVETWTFIHWLFMVLDIGIIFFTYVLEWSLLCSWWLIRVCNSWILTRFVFNLDLRCTLFKFFNRFIFKFIPQRWFFASILRNCLWFFAFTFINFKYWFIFFETLNFFTLFTLYTFFFFLSDIWVLTLDILFFCWRVKRRMFAFNFFLSHWRV